jgi:hypothetical protein
MSVSVQAAIAKANRLDAQARLHKSQAEFHRREAKRKHIELAHFIASCTRLGITVVIEPMPRSTSGYDEDPPHPRTG